MNKKMNKRREKFLFVSTIILLALCAIAFNPDINRGLFKETAIQQSIEFKPIEIEQFSPIQLVNWTPIVLALLIIISVILKKEGKLHLNGFKKSLINSAKSIQKRIDNIKGIDIANITKKLSKLKPHKHIKKHYYTNIHPKVHHEVSKTKDLFAKQYEEKFTDHYVALLFIIAVLGMSIFALTPSLNPGVIADRSSIDTINYIEQTAGIGLEIEQFSPEPLLNFLPFITALSIILIVCILKAKKDHKEGKKKRLVWF